MLALLLLPVALAKDKLWIVVSEGDERAYPGENAMAAIWEQEAAAISRAVWNGRADAAEFSSDVKAIRAKSTPINYVALQKERSCRRLNRTTELRTTSTLGALLIASRVFGNGSSNRLSWSPTVSNSIDRLGLCPWSDAYRQMKETR